MMQWCDYIGHLTAFQDMRKCFIFSKLNITRINKMMEVWDNNV